MPLKFEGKVTTGLGKGKEFVTLDGYVDQFRSDLGYIPYPGTMNLDVDDFHRQRLEDLDALRIEQWNDDGTTYGAVDCYPVTLQNLPNLNGVPIHVIVPRRTEHDSSVLELISPANLRETLDVSDGSAIAGQVKSVDTANP